MTDMWDFNTNLVLFLKRQFDEPVNCDPLNGRVNKDFFIL